MSNSSLDAAKRLLSEDTWLAIEDELLVSIAGPDELPYLAVFSSEEHAKEVFPGLAYRSACPGEPFAAAATAGTGLVLDLDLEDRAVFSHASVRELCEIAQGGEPGDEPPLVDLEADYEVGVTLPDEERAPSGLLRALFHVAESDSTLARAWLVLLNAEEDLSTLAMVVEVADAEAFEGQKLADRIGWAAPSSTPVLLIVASESSPLGVDQLEEWPCLYEAEADDESTDESADESPDESPDE